MKEGILLLFGICFCFALCELLLPTEGASGTRRLLRFLLSRTVGASLATPLLSFLRSDPFKNGLQLEFEEGEQAVYQEIFENAMQAQSEQDLRAGLALLLQREYGIAKGECEILVFFAADGSLQRICIYVSGVSLTVDPLWLQGELEKRFDCVIEVR
ncbi:MAG: hypothetical protein IJW22_05360 [Clostridia bacterium]|nr:hypothetical protein [Clostridia bacterium]